MKFKQLAPDRKEDLYFGTARFPVATRRGLDIYSDGVIFEFETLNRDDKKSCIRY